MGAMRRGYVVSLTPADGPRLFWSRTEGRWTDRFGEAEVFQALHEANGFRDLRGGDVDAWADAYLFEALEHAPRTA